VDRASNPAGNPIPLPPQRFESGVQPTFGEPKRDQLPVWLVSGNERFNFDQNTATAYPAGYLTPLNNLGDPATNPDVIELVSTGSATDATKSVDGLDGRVRVRRQAITAASARSGSYAYWVGDESLKANFGVTDPFAQSSPGSVEYRNRLQVPQRLGWERIKGIDIINLDPNSPEFLKLASTAQIQHLNPNAGPPVRAAFHHLTIHSQSLLTDTALGGLKKDLTRFLDNAEGLATNDPIPDADLYDPQDPRFRAWGGTNTGFPANGAADGLPTWGQVRTWYQNTAAGAGGAISPDENTAPVVTYTLLNMGLSYNPSTRQIHWHWAPAVVLWNPYDVSLASATYDLELHVSPDMWRFNVVNTNPSLSELQQDSGAQWADRPIGPGGTMVRSFRSPQLNSETGTNFWPIIRPDNPLYQKDNYGTAMGKSSSPNAYNIGGRGPFTYDNTFADGTTDGFGRFYYNLRLLTAFAGRATDPFITHNPSTAATTPPFNNAGGTHGGSESQGKNWGGGMRFRPHNLSSLNQPPFNTPLRFRISTGFRPGESRIFSMVNPLEWDPINGAPVPLTSGFESDGGGYLHFPILEVINGPSSANNLRFYFETLAGTRVAPMVRLSVNGSLVMENRWFGGEGALNAFIQGNNFNNINISTLDTDGDGSPNHAWNATVEQSPKFIDQWKPLYATDQIADNISTLISQYILDTGATNYAFMDWGEQFLTPFTAAGNASHGDIFTFIPGFSRMNLSAAYADLHPLLDQLRNRYGVNNRNHLDAEEGMTKIEMFRSFGKAATPRWDNDQANGLNGFSLITYRERNTETYKGLSELPVRLARRPNSNILSLGQFQQINLSPYSWQPAFPIGNSWAGIYNDREAIAGIHSRRPGLSESWTLGKQPRQPQVIPNSMAFSFTGRDYYNTQLPTVEVPANSMLDMSYVLNENLWDRYFLSTIPASPGPVGPLPNSRHRFADSAPTAGSELTNFDTSAAHVRNHGALNVNSTSVEAWKALLSAFRDLSLGDNPNETAPVARTLDPIGDSIRFTLTGIDNSHIGATLTNKDYERILNGFRYMDDPMIQALAERIVDEVRLRGPFLSMGDFVNRRLNAPQGSNSPGSPWFTTRTNGWATLAGRSPLNNYQDHLHPSYDPFVGLHGLTGPLQRAIDLSGINGGINHPDLGPSGTGSSNSLDRVFTPKIRNTNSGEIFMNNEFTGSGIGGAGNTLERHTHEPSKRGHIDTEHLAGAPAGEVGFLMQGAPGFITQGDLLAMLGPALTARGDTFLIRTYGDRTDTTGANVQARAYLEAVVQRVPEPVTPAGPSGADAWRPTDAFGRRFKIISIRWLIPEEI
jgi:hypothetical protein